jgi:hypothetical protein
MAFKDRFPLVEVTVSFSTTQVYLLRTDLRHARITSIYIPSPSCMDLHCTYVHNFCNLCTGQCQKTFIFLNMFMYFRTRYVYVKHRLHTIAFQSIYVLFLSHASSIYLCLYSLWSLVSEPLHSASLFIERTEMEITKNKKPKARL